MRLSTFLALAFLAATTHAASKPRSGENEDGSAPRAALLMYDKLVGPHQGDRALPLYYADSTRDKTIAQILARRRGVFAYLHKVAAEKFGGESADEMLHAVGAVTVQDINDAKIV